MYLVILLCIIVSCVRAQTTVTAAPLFSSNDALANEEKIEVPQAVPAQPVAVQKTNIQKPVASVEKAPPVVIKKKTLLKSRYVSSKRFVKKSKKAATRRA